VLWQVRVAQWQPTGGLGSQLGARALKDDRGLRICNTSGVIVAATVALECLLQLKPSSNGFQIQI
jgi:hypothetical protein